MYVHVYCHEEVIDSIMTYAHTHIRKMTARTHSMNLVHIFAANNIFL